MSGWPGVYAGRNERFAAGILKLLGQGIEPKQGSFKDWTCTIASTFRQ